MKVVIMVIMVIVVIVVIVVIGWVKVVNCRMLLTLPRAEW